MHVKRACLLVREQRMRPLQIAQHNVSNTMFHVWSFVGVNRRFAEFQSKGLNASDAAGLSLKVRVPSSCA